MDPSTSLAVSAGTSLSLQVRSVDDLQRLAKLFAASGLFGQPRGNPDAFTAECAIKLLLCMEAGFAPSSVTGVTVINGKPGFGANLLAQAIKRHHRYDYRVLEKTADVCRIRFLDRREELGVETFTMQMAERAGLIKQGPWRQYPEAMLFARCLSAGMRTHCPDALNGAGAYTPEELGAVGPIDENGSVVPVTVSEPPAAVPMLSTADELLGGAERACEASGLTAAGIRAFALELTKGDSEELADLPANVLARIAKSGVSSVTVERCNGGACQDDEDDEPIGWLEPAA